MTRMLAVPSAITIRIWLRFRALVLVMSPEEESIEARSVGWLGPQRAIRADLTELVGPARDVTSDGHGGAERAADENNRPNFEIGSAVESEPDITMSQIELAQLAVAAIGTGALVLTLWVYYQQLKAMQGQLETARSASTAQHVLALATFLQAEHVRDAREQVRVRLGSKAFLDWDHDDRRHASRVCSTYDVAAIVIRMGLVPAEPFVHNWGPSIIACYKIAKPLIDELQREENSGKTYWDDLDWLYKQAVLAIGPATPGDPGMTTRPV
jgi:hypothetical protein